MVNPRLQQALTQQVLHLGWEYIRELTMAACSLVQMFLERHRDEILPKNLELASFVLVSAVESVTHAALLNVEEEIPLDALVDEVCALILRYLLGEAW